MARGDGGDIDGGDGYGGGSGGDDGVVGLFRGLDLLVARAKSSGLGKHERFESLSRLYHDQCDLWNVSIRLQCLSTKSREITHHQTFQHKMAYTADKGAYPSK